MKHRRNLLAVQIAILISLNWWSLMYPGAGFRHCSGERPAIRFWILENH